MFVNKIYRLTKNEYKEFAESSDFRESFVAEIEGDKIQSRNDYLNEAWDKLRFPQTGFINFNAYLDWIRDLDWIKEESVILVILNFERFLKDDLELKTEIVETLDEIVLPWWQEEVLNCVVEGEVRPFNVFLVD